MQTETQDMTQTLQSTQPRNPIEVEVNEMIKLMHDFSLVLEKENEFLRAARFNDIEQLQDEKRSYVARYKAKVAALFERKPEVSRLDPSLAERLIVTRTDFIKLLAVNLRTLEGAKDASRRLVKRVLDTAKEKVEEKTNYNAAGAMMSSNVTSATSIGFNQEL